MIDPTLMRQVFHNLLINAIKYTKLAKKSRINVRVAEAQKTNEVVVSVKDEGIGIDIKAQPAIFEKFFRADVARRLSPEGSGLGLYVSKMIIEASGGRILFESAGHGKGAVFSIALPQKGMKTKKGPKGLAV